MAGRIIKEFNDPEGIKPPVKTIDKCLQGS